MRRRERPILYLTPRQVQAVIEAAKTKRDKAMLAVIYQFGLRRSEVEHLLRQDWDPTASAHGTLTVLRVKNRKVKGDSESVMETDCKPLWARVGKLLEEYLDSRTDYDDALFIGKRGALGGKGVYDVYKKVAKSIGLPKDLRHPHCLRHSIATHMASSGTSLLDIADWLGHNHLSTTLRYAKVLTPRKEDLILRTERSHRFARF